MMIRIPAVDSYSFTNASVSNAKKNFELLTQLQLFFKSTRKSYILKIVI